MDQILVVGLTQKKKEVMKMSKIMLVVALGWFGQGVVWDSMPNWAWPVWGRAGLENIFSRVKIFSQDIG